MIALDSWIFLEYYSFGPKRERCEKLIFSKQKKIISTILLMEILYRSTKKLGKIKTKEIIRNIVGSSSISLIDVNRNIAELAAQLRLKYYKKGEKELSFADVIHLATAIVSKCSTFYSGDPDFKNIEEIKTLIL